MNTSTSNNNLLKLSFSIPEFSQASSLGRSKIYAEIKAGKLIAHKMGKRTIILLEDGKAYLSSLPVLEAK